LNPQWIPDSSPGHGAALLFDADGRAKPAYQSVRRALKHATPRGQ